MWLFEAHYTDMKTGRETVRTVEFNGQNFEDEKECYLYAAESAYDMTEENETFYSFEFISC